MPPRLVILAVVAFWLAMTGLFVARDVWPSFRPSEPDFFPIDLVDEAGRENEPVAWSVLRNGADVYGANLDWRYDREEDAFESACQLLRREAQEPPPPDGPDWAPRFQNVHMESTLRLHRRGHLVRLGCVTTWEAALPGDDREELEFKTTLEGEPAGGRLAPRLSVGLEGLKPGEALPAAFDPDRLSVQARAVPLSSRGLVLNPLHPFRRAPDLRDGQRWPVAFVEPLGLLALLGAVREPAAGPLLRAAGLDPDAPAYVLDGRVLPGTEEITWDGQPVACRVVTFASETAPVGPVTFWARASDGVVLQHEARLWEDTWTFVRRTANYRIAPPKGQPRPAK
jgi:hypothetical protein